LRRGDIVDSLRMGWKVPEPRERLTMLVIVGMSTEEHVFEKPSGYQVRIRLFIGTVEQGLQISDSDAGLKVEKQVLMKEKVYMETQQEKCWLERSEVWKFCL